MSTRHEREMEEENGIASSISVLPEGCISEILSLTTPRDASGASAVSIGFKSAADSDAVWERFLPPDYREIIGRSVFPVVYDTTKQLYFQLSDSHIVLDGSKLSFMLDKWSGKKCYMLPARELSIAWKEESQHWTWKPRPESRFSEVAELVWVCWLEIRGKIGARLLSPKSTYAAYLVFKIVGHSVGLDTPSKTFFGFVGEITSSNGSDSAAETRNAYLRLPSLARRPYDMLRREDDRLPHERMDGWMEIELGEIFNDVGDDGEVEMVFKEVNHLNLKRGLIIEGMELRPKEKS